MATTAMISGPPSALVVRARRKLNTPEAVEQFTEELARVLDEHQTKGIMPAFEDFDISQNKLSADGFESIFYILQATCVKVQMLRAFGCPTLNDHAMISIAGWLANVTSETVPQELHLSDCALTTEGFTHFIAAVEGNAAFPPINPLTQKPTPTYVRLENNFIDESLMREKIEEGVIYIFAKGKGGPRGDAPASHPGAKLKLLALDGHQLKQRTGEPPSPEHAPPPKQVNDRSSWTPSGHAPHVSQPQARGARPTVGKGVNVLPSSFITPRATPGTAKGCGKAAVGKGQAVVALRPVARVYQPVGKGTVTPSVGRVLTAGSAGKAARVGAARVGAARVGAKGGAGALTGTRGTSAADRSRTPPPKVAKKSGLPHPWEEHWSDDYGIPYYWNTKTGDSMWEKPTH
eukprot:NODE_8211_length_1514_cov_5.154290.p1 GENE.NODE_8211_length_1514_cov_5.154290~~NODE_8211_length_1514_cov_5.154290.p1  ORF type:complete len:430 (+),score=103.99 NODE_8211_length_1514_cov_5.154290:81-1292(+)